MKGYAHMSKENVISLAGKAIENILKERERRIEEVIKDEMENPSNPFDWLLNVKTTRDAAIKRLKEDERYPSKWTRLQNYGASLTVEMNHIIFAAQVAEDYMLVDVELASAMYLWGEKE